MNWWFLIYSITGFLASFALYFNQKKWIENKKKQSDLDYFDKGTIIPKGWLLIISSLLIGVVFFLKFIFNF